MAEWTWPRTVVYSTDTTMLTCKEIADFLGDYLERELPQPAASEFERHLSLCPECVCFLNSYRDTILAEKRSHVECGEARPEIPKDLAQAIVAALEAASKQKS